MTDKEIIENIRKVIEGSVSTDAEESGRAYDALEQAIKIIEKRHNYRWHNLENSEDLPLKDLDVEVVNDDGIHHIAVLKETDDDYYEWFIKYCLYDRDVWDTEENGEIVAWRYLEPFN